MVDTYGRWTPEADYSTYPKEKWCDMDRAYQIILESGYKVRSDVESFIEFLIEEFYEDEDYNPKVNQNLMIDVDMLEGFVRDNGGLKEFDFEC